ncbi:MAG: hypothetical protein HY735_30375 [Verrucomicrobia bacterium]|nr:hypothetical protein [Verrucomicrobiota bacterium]
MNLVINASEAIRDHPGSITVATGRMRASREYLAGTVLSPEIPEGEYVYLEVADTGCGMSAETVSRIFDPFFTTKFTGRGLGLAAVLGIVRGHKGALQVTSQIGRGSIFRLLLPVAAGRETRAVPLDQRETVTRFAGQGLAGFLQKPFRLDALRESMQNAFSEEITSVSH